MTSFAPTAGVRAGNGLRAATLTRSVFIAAILLSAFLLFSVQPMFAKMVLPILGGTPAVWSVAMVFFQALLLAGYLYAHLLVRALDIRIAGLVHLGLMACAFLTLPISVAAGWGKPPASGEAFWLLGLFVASVGLPFFAVAGNGPLLQAWFARSGHPQAHNPYFLYAASNIGSFAALVSYPVAIEPFLSLREQSHWWAIGFLGLAVLVGACAVLAGHRLYNTQTQAPSPIAQDAPPTWWDRAAWAGLSFIPSGLLVAITAHISTDIAAAPLLWVVPLALFLLTFVLAFRDRPLLAAPGVRRLQVWGAALVILTAGPVANLFVALLLHLGVFFLSALVCHATLYEKRPSANRLTEFYLWMSLGGVLGGVFCGLLAPNIFSTVIEYPLLLGLTILGCKAAVEGGWRTWAKEGGRAALACAVALAVIFLIAQIVTPTRLMTIMATAAFAAAMMAVWRVPQHVLPAALCAALVGSVLQIDAPGHNVRSFFGVHKIAPSENGQFLTLYHGTTLHGAIRLKNEDGSPASDRPEPTTYYAFDGAIGTAVSSVRAVQGGMLSKVAAIGLGSGSLACHAQPGENWTFFEIDPAVAAIARDPRFFRFMQECAPQAPVILGDARLTLADRSGGNSLIVVDAFSSDSIPIHLLTKEAVGLYLSRLSPDGTIVFHISNRHMDLRRILARIAAEHRLVAYMLLEEPREPFERRYRTPSSVMILARQSSHLGRIAEPDGWPRIEPDMSRRPWTDDFSNILEAVIDDTWGGPPSGP
jgi:hypothetical protein